jgi:Insertion element 4 transposase N-terminal/Transposase DDE domain
MARSAMTMGTGGKIAEHLSIGVLAQIYPWERVSAVLRQTDRASERVRDLPAEVVTYYVMGLGLFMAVSTREVLRVLVEGLQWLGAGQSVKVASKAAISQARTRLGAAPLKQLWEQTAQPLVPAGSAGAFYRGRRLVALDGTTLDVPDTKANASRFGKPGASRGQAAFPQVRLVGLVETGAHAVLAVALAPYQTGEHTLAREVVPKLTADMLCLADRLFASFGLWQLAGKGGAQLLWRVRANYRLPVETALPDGSYLSSFYASTTDRRHRTNGVRVRVIEYTLENHPQGETYRLMTTLLDPTQAPALELAALYPERWELEGVFDELKTHLRGGQQVVLRSKTPALVEQEIYGLLLAHRAVRTLMCRAAHGAQLDPDRLSFTHSVRVLRRKLARRPDFPPSTGEALVQ